MSMDLFRITATVFLVILTVAFLVFAVKYIRTRVGGRGPVGMFADPRHTFAQYDDREDEGEWADAEGGDKAGAEDRQKFR